MDKLAVSALYLGVFVTAAMPGPCAIFAASRTARGGVRSGILVSIGVILGATALTALAFGVLLGTLAVSDSIFIAMKWAGVLALLVLAGLTLRADLPTPAQPERQAPAGTDLSAGALLVLTSPGALVFLLAVLPQFVATEGAELTPAIVAACLFVAGGATVQAGAVIFGACSLRLGTSLVRRVEYASASLLIGFAGLAVVS